MGHVVSLWVDQMGRESFWVTLWHLCCILNIIWTGFSQSQLSALCILFLCVFFRNPIADRKQNLAVGFVAVRNLVSSWARRQNLNARSSAMRLESLPYPRIASAITFQFHRTEATDGWSSLPLSWTTWLSMALRTPLEFSTRNSVNIFKRETRKLHWLDLFWLAATCFLVGIVFIPPFLCG